MKITLPPMKIISDNERLFPVIMGQKKMVYFGKEIKYGGHPRSVPTKAYKECKQILIDEMIGQTSQKCIPYMRPWNYNIKIKILAKTYKDIGNIRKILTDSIQEAGIIENDRYITFLMMTKIPVKRGQLDEVEIYVTGEYK